MLGLSFSNLTREHSKLAVVEFAAFVGTGRGGTITHTVSVDVGWYTHSNGSVLFGEWVREADRMDVVHAENQVVRHRLEKVGLVLESQALVHIAAKDAECVKRPVDLLGHA